MTQEEYELIESIPEDNLITYRLDERLKDLTKRIDEKRLPNGGVYWLDGPFHSGLPRNEYIKDK
jgi:hypothetical protein